MSASDMQVFNEFFMPMISETVAQKTMLFNEASQGAIVLQGIATIGDFSESSFYNLLSAAQRRVNIYGTNNPVTPINLSQNKKVGVKVAGGFGPVNYEPIQMNWLRKLTSEGVEVFSRQFAELLVQDQVNTAIAALVAAIGNNANATRDVSGGASITQQVINSSHRKFGDASQMLVCEVMSGSMYHQLMDKALLNATELFNAGNVTVMSILGKSIVITDAPALTLAGSPNKDRVLSLVSGAAMIKDPQDPIFVIHDVTGGERIVTQLQADYSFEVEVLGYSWDTVNGGKSPSNAAIATGTNWDLNVASVKHTAGVLAIGDEAVI